MNTIAYSDPLPPVRKRVFRYSLWIVFLYGVVGIYMTAAVYLASGITPKAIHLNYDSIAAARKMSESWTAIRNPEQYPIKSPQFWKNQFEDAIQFEESNISEKGEKEIAFEIRKTWDQFKTNPSYIAGEGFQLMNGQLEKLVTINENGIFGWAAESYRFRQYILLITIIVFISTIAIALYLADGLSVIIATPLRELSAALKRKPEPGSKLKLPQPDTLEMRVLSSELANLWQRVSDLQKLNLEEISAQRKQLQTVLTSVDDAILVLDNQERVIHCNEGMLLLIALPSSEVIGSTWRDLSSITANYLILRNNLTPQISSDIPLELALESQSRFYSGRSRHILDENNAQIGTLYLLHDITEVKLKDRLKSEFIGVLSHELKTPLQSLGTASELLLTKRQLLDEDGKMLVETIHEDVGRIRGVANEFIQVGLVDLHSLRLKIEAVPINSLLQQWIQPFQVIARDRGIKIEYSQEGSDTITARLDPVKFPWAITNLLSNAVRVSPPQSTITIHLTDRDGKIDIEIRDEGPGIALTDRGRMFEPFYQGSQQSGDKVSGFLGLGLTITKEVVEAHDGEIEYYPRKPNGSVFRIRLPLLM